MGKVFSEGSQTVKMLATAREARGDVFADTLKEIAILKETALQDIKDGKTEEESMAAIMDRSKKVVSDINEHGLDKDGLFMMADCLLAVAKVEGLRDEAKEADDVNT